MKQWLAERLQVLLPRLAVLGKDQEAEIKLLCEEEIAYWRSRPTMKSLRSLNTPMIDARNAIKEQLSVTQENSWINPRTGEREHLARRYLNFSEAEWAAMHALTEEGRELRLEGQQLLDDPDAIVARGAELLGSQRWEDLAVGLAVITGRRLTEILKTAHFHPMSAYTVLFEGQLKQKAELLAPYEIPTLVEADLVIEATGRLRTLLSCRDLENTEVERRYGPTVRATTHRYFQQLIRIRANDVNVYTHACRAVYGRIATYYFAPPVVNALVYLATIQGHYWLLRTTSEEQRRNYLSTLHYDDYKISDGRGNIDGRQGIRLGEPGVKVLSVFEEAVTAQHQKEARERMAKQQEQTLPIIKASKTGYSMLKPKQATAQRVLQIMHERELRHHDEVLSLLADTYRLYEQMQELLAPLAKEFGATMPLETLKAVLAAGGQRPVEIVLDDYLQAKWGASLSELTALFDQAATQGEEKPLPYLREQLTKRANYQQGPVTRQERYKKMDFTTLTLAELKALRIPEATTERIRRAVAAIMQYNQAATHELDRWFIRAKEIKELVGGRGELIAEYLKLHQAEIAAHHQLFGLTEKYNTKPYPITHAIHLEQADASGNALEIADPSAGSRDNQQSSTAS